MGKKRKLQNTSIEKVKSNVTGFNYFECVAIQIHKMERKITYVKIYYLISSSSMDDRLDKDAQVFPSLSGLVAF